jgi:hypothetical protein
MKKTFLALAACGAMFAGSAIAAELEAESLSAAYIEKCPESIQVLIDMMTEANTVIEGTDTPAIEDQWMTEPGCGTEHDRVYVDLMRPEVIQEYNDLLAKGELQAKLDSDIKLVAEEILKIEPMLKRAQSGVTTREELANMVVFAEAQNRKKTIEEMVADE